MIRDCWIRGGINVKNLDKRGLPMFVNFTEGDLLNGPAMIVEYENCVDHSCCDNLINMGLFKKAGCMPTRSHNVNVSRA